MKTAAMKQWDSKFLSARDAKMIGTQYPGIEYLPFHQLSRQDQQRAIGMYPHKSVGAKYPFIDEHYFYPVSRGALYSGGHRVQRVLAIPYKMMLDEAYMASLGYAVSPTWKGASELVKIAKEVMAYSQPKESYAFAAELGKVPGVVQAVVDDFTKVSSGPDLFKVFILVYADPEIGGRLTNRLKGAVNKISRALSIKVWEFWTPRSDRDITDVGVSYLRDFYKTNPYKVTIICHGEEFETRPFYGEE